MIVIVSSLLNIFINESYYSIRILYIDLIGELEISLL